METIAKVVVVASLALGTGCAHIPDVSVGYYLSRAKPSFKVTRTVACDSDKNIIAGAVVVPTVTHHADHGKPVSVVLTPLRGPLSDNDVKFDFYDDGRLKGVNTTTTGQAEGVLKTALTVASSMVAIARTRAFDPKAACDYIEKTNPTQKLLTLTYEGEVDPELKKARYDLGPDLASKVYADNLEKLIGQVCAEVLDTQAMAKPVIPQKKEKGVALRVRQPALVRMRINAGGPGQCSQPVWEGTVPVGQSGTEYDIPVPRAAWFGKQTFAAGFHESGAISNVQYVSTTGAGQVLNVVSQGLTEIQNEAAKKAAALNAEAALIAAQQRLVKCKADPANCS